MIKANELRIGNLVTLSDGMSKELFDTCDIVLSKKTAIVLGLNEHECLLKLFTKDENLLDIVNIDFDYKEISPVRTTLVCLKKLGFETMGYGVYKQNEFYIHESHDYDHHGFWWVKDGLWVELKYLHQLQNLYFDLIIKELEFKL